MRPDTVDVVPETTDDQLERVRAARRSSLRSWDDVRAVDIVSASDRRRDSSRSGMWMALSLAALAAAACGGFVVGKSRSTVRTEVVTVTVPVSAATTTAPATSLPVTTTVPSTTAPTTVPPTTTTLATPTGEIIPVGGRLVDGVLMVAGSLPSAEAVSAASVRAVGLLAADKVVVGYVADPRVPAGDVSPLANAVVSVAEPIRFSTGGTEPTEASRAILDQVISLMTKAPASFVVVNSYTDDEGDELRNVGLAKQRIDVVTALFEAAGIAPSRVIPSARGEQNPVADNATPEGRAENRRIELTIHRLL